MKSTMSKIFLLSLFAFGIHASDDSDRRVRLECVSALMAPTNRLGQCVFKSQYGDEITLRDTPWSFVNCASRRVVYLRYDRVTDATTICTDNPAFINALAQKNLAAKAQACSKMR